MSQEASRLQALERYRIMDTRAEKAFDDLTGLAASICGTPIALISFVDERRQWFKSRHGLEVTETAREIAFCSAAIDKKELLIVEDAAADQRFRSNPLVTASPYIRFYAGVPLIVANGHALGTLCVLDRRPRTLSAREVGALVTLRAAVVTLIELKHSLEELDVLKQLLPVCAWCQNIQDANSGAWRSPYEYLAERKALTHGMCPSCSEGFSAQMTHR